MTNIYCFESTDAGAPQTNNVAGTLIALLDACLISGYNSKSVTSITVSAGVATVVCTAHGFSAAYGKIIAISGATPAGLNIHTRITDVTANGFKFLCPGVIDGAATGTLVAKYAPLGWTKPFSATNKAMYKRGDIVASSPTLRVDDTGTSNTARVLMVQGATDLDTYYDPGPTSVQVAGGAGYWAPKARYTGSAFSDWMLISDGLLLYFFCRTQPAVGAGIEPYMPFVFGDIVSFKPGDTLGCIIGGLYDGGNCGLFNNQSSQFVLAGGSSGVTKNVIATGLRTLDLTPGASTLNSLYPSAVDGGLLLYAAPLFQETIALYRGVMPGMAQPVQALSGGAALAVGARVVPTNGSSRVFMYMHIGSTITSTSSGASTFIDLTGPWR